MPRREGRGGESWPKSGKEKIRGRNRQTSVNAVQGPRGGKQEKESLDRLYLRLKGKLLKKSGRQPKRPGGECEKKKSRKQAVLGQKKVISHCTYGGGKNDGKKPNNHRRTLQPPRRVRLEKGRGRALVGKKALKKS